MKKYKNATFLGDEMAQSEKEFRLWEKILTDYNFKRIIDLGTWEGSHALYLHLFAANKGAKLFTFDIKGYKDSPAKQLVNFEGCFCKDDIFNQTDFIKRIIQKPGRTIIFCDNGNKIKEFKIFKPSLKLGDIVAIHDWGSECKETNINLSGLQEIARADRLIFFKRMIK